jgi:hypothetical protein
MSSKVDTPKTITDKMTAFFSPFQAIAAELANLFPDSVLFGSFILYAITQNLSYGVFALFLFETSLLHRLTGFIVQQTIGAEAQADPSSCGVSGFRNPRFAMERLTAVRPQVVSPFLFYAAATLIYLCAAIGQFKETLDKMGPDWSGRFYFVVIAAPLFTALMMVLYWVRGCMTVQGGLLAAVAGCLAGGALYMLNKTLFGPEGMNFLGLPFLIDKTDTGEPIYICSASPITAPNQS